LRSLICGVVWRGKDGDTHWKLAPDNKVEDR